MKGTFKIGDKAIDPKSPNRLYDISEYSQMPNFLSISDAEARGVVNVSETEVGFFNHDLIFVGGYTPSGQRHRVILPATEIDALIDALNVAKERAAAGGYEGHVFMDHIRVDGDESKPAYAFAAFIENATWNGWASPGFTKEVADQFVAIYNDLQRREAEAGHEAQPAAYYSADGDQYVFPSTEYPEDPEVFPNTKGRYWIGAWSWVWTDIDPQTDNLEEYEVIK